MKHPIKRLALAGAVVVTGLIGHGATSSPSTTHAVAAGSTTELVVTGQNGVPNDASAVVLNVTAADAPGTGYVTVWPCGEARPNASNVNFRPGGAVANSVIVRVGAGGKVCLFTETATQLIVDINGWYPAGASFTSGSPSRVMDTRSGGATVDGADAGVGVRGAGSVTELRVAPRAGVPANASAVVLNVTAADAPGTGYVTVWPCGEARPNASNVNFRPGGAVANSVIVRVGAGGKVCLFTETATQLIVDINGWYPAGASFTSGSPSRVMDTRSGGATVDGADAGVGVRGAGSVTELRVAPRAGVPANASAVVLNVTAADAPGTGYVTVWPCGEARPNASNVNFRPGGAVANSVIVRVGAGGKVCLFTETATQLIVDINGWYRAAADFTATTPARLLDTRTAAPTASGPTPVPAGAQFVEAFDGNSGLGSFDYGIYHRDEFLVAQTQWSADHDMACGAPDTQRTVSRNDPASSFYVCKDHIMTSIGDTAGYSTGWFSPKPTFSGVRQVSWDVGVTDLLNRKWWEVSVVPASFNSGVPSCTHCSVISWLSPDPSGLPPYPSGSVVVGNGPYGGGFNVHANGADFNPAGFREICGSASLDPEGCASKSIRRTFVLTDNGNGTITINAFGQNFTFPGSFPSGDVKVVFKDHNYTPNKDGVPVGQTWHWDNIVVS